MSFVRIPQISGYYEFRRVRRFPKDKARRIGKALWMENEGALFINCARCGTINSLEGFELHEVPVYYGPEFKIPKNVINPCIHCLKGDAVFGAQLLDWEKVSKKVRGRFATRYQRKVP